MKLCKNILALVSVASATCYDGNNGGCSHTCKASVCSCPPCWTLSEDGKKCEFEAGKAQLTCSKTGAEIVIDKCALTGIDASSIHLKDTACSATEVDADTLKIATGFSDCESELGFSADKLTLSNTLTIGLSIVTGRVISRKYEIDFSCNYNNFADASTMIRASNVLFEDITFDLNDAQPAELAFEFGLNFYESADFTSQADLTNGAFQPGTSLFGRIAPKSALAAALEFSVGKCTVEDTSISQSLDILDQCPVDGTAFQFRDLQSDQSAVQFSFEGFVFPTSADDTTIDVTCAVNICPANSLECLKLCDEDSGVDGGNDGGVEKFLVMIRSDITASFIINQDGSETTFASINAATSYYASASQSAVVQDKVHIFGGDNNDWTDSNKIARLDDCTFVELPYRLYWQYKYDHAVLSISDNSKALICFQSTYEGFDECEVFTGSSVEPISSSLRTSYPHWGGQLGFYNGQPTTVSTFPNPPHASGYQKVETLTESGWIELEDHPMHIYGHTLIGVGNDLLMIGGYDGSIYAILTDVWRLSDNVWSQESESLKQKVYAGSAIANGNSIFIIGGVDDNNEGYSQRIDLDENDEIVGVEQIAVLDGSSTMPVLFGLSQNICVSL